MCGLFADLRWEMRDAEIRRSQSCCNFCRKVDRGCYRRCFNGPLLNWEVVALYEPNAIIRAVAHGDPHCRSVQTQRAMYRQYLNRWLPLHVIFLGMLKAPTKPTLFT